MTPANLNPLLVHLLPVFNPFNSGERAFDFMVSGLSSFVFRKGARSYDIQCLATTWAFIGDLLNVVDG